MKVVLPIYEVIVTLHDTVLETSGGRPGIHNESAIHGAVARPKTYLGYNPDCDLHTVCAVLLDSIARNHGFKDGNKRTGLMTTLYTYRINGVYLKFNLMMNKDYEELVLWVVIQKPDIPETAKKLRELTDRYGAKGIDNIYEKLKDSL
jgi:death-on-curing family protein